MSAIALVKTCCPVCRNKYRVPAKLVSHRARCTHCHSVFRVAAERSNPPTEEDILRWLSEGDEDVAEHEQTDPQHVPEPVVASHEPEPAINRLSHPATDMQPVEMALRKTG